MAGTHSEVNILEPIALAAMKGRVPPKRRIKAIDALVRTGLSRIAAEQYVATVIKDVRRSRREDQQQEYVFTTA